MRRPASHLLADDVLLARTRDDDRSAYGELWLRHSAAAYAVARAYPRLDADDVVAEAFSRVLAALRGGRGPDLAFRPYLLMTVRNVIRDWGTRPAADTVDDFDQTIDPAALDAEEATIAALDGTAASTAFRSLPTRWQEALWYSEVDGLKPRQFAPLLGLAPNAASALVARARRAFRDAWVTSQLARADSPECQVVLDNLGAHTRGAVSARQRRAIDEHLDGCTSCAIAWTEARDVASQLVLVLLPLCAGAAGATGYLAWAHEGAAAVSASLAPAGTPGPASVRGPGATSRGGIVAVAAAGIAAVAVAAALVVNALPGADPTTEALPAAAAQDAPAGSDAPASASASDGEAPSEAVPAPIPTPQPSTRPQPSPPPSRPSSPSPAKDPGASLAEPVPASDGSGSATEPVPGVPGDPGTTTPEEPDPLPTPTMSVDTSAGPLVYPLVSGGDALPGGVVDLVDDAGTVLASTTADADGSWSIGEFSGAECATDVGSYLPAGEHTIRPRQSLDGAQSAEGAPITFTLSAPPVFSTPTAGQTVSHTGFELAFTGVPNTSVQRIRIPDAEPCRPVPMVTDAVGAYSGTYSVPEPETFTLGLRYIDPATGRHGAAVFVTFTAE